MLMRGRPGEVAYQVERASLDNVLSFGTESKIQRIKVVIYVQMFRCYMIY